MDKKIVFGGIVEAIMRVGWSAKRESTTLTAIWMMGLALHIIAFRMVPSIKKRVKDIKRE